MMALMIFLSLFGNIYIKEIILLGLFNMSLFVKIENIYKTNIIYK